ncbi:MAG: diguanylate cyclase [Cellulosilyticaceae bacterium]
MLYSHTIKTPTIGVILGNLEDPCQSQILSGLTQYAKTKSIHLMTFVGTTYDETNHYLPNYGLLSKLIGSSKLDALIVMTGAISSLVSMEEIESFTQDCPDLPLLSIASPLEGCTNLLIDNQSGIHQIMDHLIADHDCKRLAFVCGIPNHVEADARLTAFKDSLMRYNLPIDPTLIFPGDFSEAAGVAAVSQLLASNNPLPDAIICVDDSTAYGVLNALKSHHISVPDTIRVTGFDDTPESKNCFPSLTTVKQPFYEVGLKAGEIVMDLLAHKNLPQDISIPTQTIIRESCGCIDHLKVDNDLYIALINHMKQDASNASLLTFLMGYITEKESPSLALQASLQTTIQSVIASLGDDAKITSSSFWVSLRNQLMAFIDQGISLETFSNLVFLVSEYSHNHHSADYKVNYLSQRLLAILSSIQMTVNQTLYREDFMYNFKLRQISQKLIASFNTSAVFKAIRAGLQDLMIPECHIILFDESYGDTGSFHLAFSYKNGRMRPIEKPLSFNSCSLLPDFINLKECGASHLILPLLTDHHNFGYMICTYNDSLDHSVFGALRSHISSGLHGALLYEKEKYAQDLLAELLTQLEERNTELQHSSVQDELTGLYNRRGFMEIAGASFEQLSLPDDDGLLFFMDLDGLKGINDTYGHQEGDLALIKTAQLLSETFDTLGCVSRLGGDEFTVFIAHHGHASATKFIATLNASLHAYNLNSHKPYELSVSIGVASAKENPDISFRELLNIADFELYKKKQARYAAKEKRT